MDVGVQGEALRKLQTQIPGVNTSGGNDHSISEAQSPRFLCDGAVGVVEIGIGVNKGGPHNSERHGTQDQDVPWEMGQRLMDHLESQDVQLTLIKDGDHRLSSPEQLEILRNAVAAMSEKTKNVD